MVNFQSKHMQNQHLGQGGRGGWRGGGNMALLSKFFLYDEHFLIPVLKIFANDNASVFF